jgi:hypothetical protein
MLLTGKRSALLLLVSLLLTASLALTPSATAATITVVNLDDPLEGFNDPAPRTPAGGNIGTTLGAQRLIAFQYAADIWGAELMSAVTVRVGANFDPLPCGATSAILGGAGATTAHRDFVGAPFPSTWYPPALANALRGVDLAPGIDDISAVFNSAIGTTCTFPRFWYYGLDMNPPADHIDFVTVVLHELAHGLGFQTFVELGTGAGYLGLDDAFMRGLEDHGTGRLYPAMSDAERVAASTNAPFLHWVGASLRAASGVLTGGRLGDHVEMYAPYPADEGSSLSHFSNTLTPNELMEPFYTGPNHDVGLSLPLMQDLGWSMEPPPLRLDRLTADRPAPQSPGITITFTATASDGIPPYQYKWWLFDGATWSILQDWSTAAAVAWTPWTPGAYRIGVWVRNAGAAADAYDNDGANASVAFTIEPPAPLILTTLSANKAAPQPPDTTITFAAAGSGGIPPYQFKWWLFDGITWSVLQDWSTAATVAWRPSTSGTYRVGVWLRNAGTNADAYDNDANASIPFTIQPVVPLVLTSLASDKTAPQPPGTTIRFNAAGSGGIPPHQFKWRLFDGTTWSVLQDWTTAATVSWTPSTPGAYRVGVWLRNAGVTTDAYDNEAASGSVPFTIQSAAPLVLIGLAPDKNAPRPPGTTVTFAATGSGGIPPYQLKWWLFDGAAWSVLQDWSTIATVTWTPSTPGAYRVGVWLRNAGSTADAYDNDSANGSVPFTIKPAAPLILTSLAPDRAAPQPPGTTVTFAATGSGGIPPYQFKWWLFDGAAWSVLQDWSTTTTVAWIPSAFGTYRVGVWLRNAGVTADAYDNDSSNGSVPFTVQSAAPLTLVSLAPDRSAPQSPGTTIRFTASGSGGTTPYQFKWRLFNGTTWSVLQDWSTAADVAWRPSIPGAYRVGVWLRNAGSTADACDNEAASGDVPFTIQPATPLVLTSLAPNRTAPQPAGTTVTFTATGSGGLPPYQFKWWLFDGAAWSVLQDWSAMATVAWTPSASGAYRVGVWLRNAGGTADISDNDRANGSVPFTIQPAAPLVLTSLVPDRTAPQPPGTTIRFTATGSGGIPPYQFKWWLFDGVTWSVLQDWSTTATVAWMPSAFGAYRVGVWLRNAGITADVFDNDRANGSIAFQVATPSAQVRFYNNLWICPSVPCQDDELVSFTAKLTASQGYTWFSQSEVYSPYQPVTTSTLSNFVGEALGWDLPAIFFPGAFHLSFGRRYVIVGTIEGDSFLLILYDEGASSASGPPSSSYATGVVLGTASAGGRYRAVPRVGRQ